MTNEFDRRDRLIDKCLDLTNLSIKQKDMDTAGLMLRKALELLVIQTQTMELMSPGYIKSLEDNPEWNHLVQMLQDANS